MSVRRPAACCVLVVALSAMAAVRAQAPSPQAAPSATDAPEAAPVAPAPEASAPASGAADRVLHHLVVIGASASYGINLRASLADTLQALIAVPHDAPLDGALGGFSMSSLDTRDNVAALAAAQDPSAVIAVDFLFWYAYGFGTDPQRLEKLEKGLAALDGFSCPVVISLIPDMSPAVEFKKLPMVMPSKETLAEMNRRITEWAGRRPHVIIVPLVEALDDMRHGRAIVVGPWSWPAGDQYRFVQADRTHPTEEGLIVLACLAAQGLRTRFPALQPGDFVADLDVVRDGMLKAAAQHPFPRVAVGAEGGTHAGPTAPAPDPATAPAAHGSSPPK